MIKCETCDKVLQNKSEFIQGTWHLFEQDGYFEIDLIGDTYYCIPCFCKQEDFGAYFDQRSLKHLEDCPLIKLRIPCDQCSYPQHEARYSSVENFIFQNTGGTRYEIKTRITRSC